MHPMTCKVGMTLTISPNEGGLGCLILLTMVQHHILILFKDTYC